MKKNTKYIIAGVAGLALIFVVVAAIKKNKDQAAQGKNLNQEAQDLLDKIKAAQK